MILCPICKSGGRPDNNIFLKLTKNQIDEIMKVKYDNYEALESHLLFSHAQIEVVELLMKYIIDA